MIDDEQVRRVFYSPVRKAVSQHLAVTCSEFLVKNPSPASNVNVSLHVGRSQDFIHETPKLLLAAGESVGNEISEAGNLRIQITNFHLRRSPVL